ncbi:hypothetical protein HOY82DRAFT_611768 [Tuber indicum]|nr:hypothetical protein HOY82DRAFT_611768 [Tuber indicum]
MARAKGCTASNASVGFRKCGLVPFNPVEVLNSCQQPPDIAGYLPSTPDSPVFSETPRNSLIEQELLEYKCSPPTTPHRRQELYQEALNLTTTSPCSRKLQTLLTAFKTALDTESASTKMAEEGERCLQESIVVRKEQAASDKPRVPQADGSLKSRKDIEPLSAQVLERGNILVQRKKVCDEEAKVRKEQVESRKRRKVDNSESTISFTQVGSEISHGSFRDWL